MSSIDHPDRNEGFPYQPAVLHRLTSGDPLTVADREQLIELVSGCVAVAEVLGGRLADLGGAPELTTGLRTVVERVQSLS